MAKEFTDEMKPHINIVANAIKSLFLPKHGYTREQLEERAIEAFILFWIDGVAGNPSVGIDRWTQVIAGAILWPPIMAIMDRIRERVERRDPSFS